MTLPEQNTIRYAAVKATWGTLALAGVAAPLPAPFGIVAPVGGRGAELDLLVSGGVVYADPWHRTSRAGVRCAGRRRCGPGVPVSVGDDGGLRARRLGGCGPFRSRDHPQASSRLSRLSALGTLGDGVLDGDRRRATRPQEHRTAADQDEQDYDHPAATRWVRAGRGITDRGARRPDRRPADGPDSRAWRSAWRACDDVRRAVGRHGSRSAPRRSGPRLRAPVGARAAEGER